MQPRKQRTQRVPKVTNVILIVLASVLFGIVFTSKAFQKQPSKDNSFLMNQGDFFIYPEEFIIYQDYIKAIGGKPNIYETGTIEATIISITKSVVCPDEIVPFAPESKGCSIEPYPKDLGIVKIDKIINYNPYSEQPLKSTIEESTEEKSLKEKETTPEYIGPEYPSKPAVAKRKDYIALQEGQEVQTIFLLTTRPVKIKYVPISESTGGLESAKSAKDGNQQTISHQVRPLKKIFKPIPKDGNYLIFTTKIGKFLGTIEKILPGLEAESKFGAEIRFDGKLYIREYVIRK